MAFVALVQEIFLLSTTILYINFRVLISVELKNIKFFNGFRNNFNRKVLKYIALGNLKRKNLDIFKI